MSYRHLVIAASVASLLGACTTAFESGDGDPESEDRTERERQINDYVRNLDPWAVETPHVEEGDPSTPAASGDYMCTTTNYKETRQYDNIVAFAANSGAMWPGALLRGDSVETGLFTPVAVSRQPMSFSVSMAGGQHSATLEDPKLSSYREALARILDREVRGATPANIYAEIEEVHSADQLAIALGVKAEWFIGSVAASFNFSDTQRRSRYVVKFTQAYFTADIDPPELPSDLLGRGVDLDDVTQHWWQGNAPVYVSSVTYGRSVMFMFESDYSLEEMRAALNFTFNAGVSISGSTSVSYREMLDQTKMTAYILGGSGEDAVKAVDSYEDLLTFIEEGGNFSKDSPGAPIAYKLAYL
ncbi:MAG: thiol-activated cytolysin family protein, partial [Deltaproteobacteria bacterium]|nr:thiol-activated cytolysin family protein [Deltaproteobacteria bacterium]